MRGTPAHGLVGHATVFALPPLRSTKRQCVAARVQHALRAAPSGRTGVRARRAPFSPVAPGRGDRARIRLLRRRESRHALDALAAPPPSKRPAAPREHPVGARAAVTRRRQNPVHTASLLPLAPCGAGQARNVCVCALPRPGYPPCGALNRGSGFVRGSRSLLPANPVGATAGGGGGAESATDNRPTDVNAVISRQYE